MLRMVFPYKGGKEALFYLPSFDNNARLQTIFVSAFAQKRVKDFSNLKTLILYSIFGKKVLHKFVQN